MNAVLNPPVTDREKSLIKAMMTAPDGVSATDWAVSVLRRHLASAGVRSELESSLEDTELLDWIQSQGLVDITAVEVEEYSRGGLSWRKPHPLRRNIFTVASQHVRDCANLRAALREAVRVAETRRGGRR